MPNEDHCQNETKEDVLKILNGVFIQDGDPIALSTAPGLEISTNGVK